MPATASPCPVTKSCFVRESCPCVLLRSSSCPRTGKRSVPNGLVLQKLKIVISVAVACL